MIQQQVFVTAAFAKPGIHQYIVADLRHPQNKLINVHEFSAETRQEDVLNYERVIKEKKGEQFNRMKSIFAPWPVENEELFKKCIEHDFSFWKIPRVIKEPADYTATKRVLLRHAKLIQ